VGANGGGSLGISEHQFTDLSVDTGTFRVDGGLFGATFGLNYQAGNWVWGVEGDVDWTSIRGSQNVGGVPFSADLQWLSTYRARLGYAFDRFFPYVTVGPAFGGLTTHASTPATGLVTGHETRSGWAVGTGLDTASAKI